MADDLYSSLIEGVPTQSARQAALARALRTQGTLGELAAFSGDRVLAPAGRSLLSDTQSGVRDLAQLKAEQAYRSADLDIQRQRISQESQDRAAQRALTGELAQERMDTQKQLAGLIMPGGGGAGGTGAAYLSTLQPQIAAQVKALAEGREQFPTGYALKSPYWQNMIRSVAQYDPTFDAVNYGSRYATRKDFTSGKSAQNLNALNTAIGHAAQLYSQIPDVNSSSFPLFNAVGNAFSKGVGGAGVPNWDQTAAALASEATRVFRGDSGAEADVNRYLQQLSANGSREQKQAVLRNLAGLFNSRIEQLGSMYNKGMGTTDQPLPMLNPNTSRIMEALQGGQAPPDMWQSATGQTGAATSRLMQYVQAGRAARAQQQAPQPQPPQAAPQDPTRSLFTGFGGISGYGP